LLEKSKSTVIAVREINDKRHNFPQGGQT